MIEIRNLISSESLINILFSHVLHLVSNNSLSPTFLLFLIQRLYIQYYIILIY